MCVINYINLRSDRLEGVSVGMGPLVTVPLGLTETVSGEEGERERERERKKERKSK